MSVHQEVVDLGKALQKAKDNNRVTEVLDLVARLSKYKATAEILKKTEIGLIVGKLRTHPDAQVANAAKNLVRKWKQDVIMASSATPKTKTESATPKPETATPSTMASSPLPPATPTSNGTTNVKPTPTPTPTPTTTTATPNTTDSSKPRSMASDGVKPTPTSDKLRDKCVEMLYNALATNSGAPASLLCERAVSVEQNVYDEFQAVSADYKGKVRTLFLNLKNKANPKLREDVVSGEIPIGRFCSMTKEEMASEERRDKDRLIHEVNMSKARSVGPVAAETDQFKCGRCKQRKCTYFQMQTRSADEPMTTFVTCTNCQNRWKFC
ncbi:transcription elongation factor TFIIS [Dispira parvispora]|uniref:Transcription elongation factor n=1 Tax=Dispira parvispora TaxID=1520584 RepID=A0A9W8ARX4_9FUNG|nr:transcription elongation factor TFIIS [Dispira parvispora]